MESLSTFLHICPTRFFSIRIKKLEVSSKLTETKAQVSIHPSSSSHHCISASTNPCLSTYKTLNATQDPWRSLSWSWPTMATDAKEKEEQPPYLGDAGVVGAGISGLSATIALRRAGWRVEVFERSQFKNEIGAAITVTANAAFFSDRWGFDMEKAEAVPNQSKVTALASDPSVILHRQEYADKASELGFGIWSLHRVDLHRGLRSLAVASTMEPGSGPPVRIRPGCEVREVGCEEGVLKLGNGRLVNKDLLAIADGAHVSAGEPRPDKQS
jgi:hypothetical protein